MSSRATATMIAPRPGVPLTGIFGWREHAACRDHDPSMWFPRSDESVIGDAAKAICATCLVRLQCLTEARRGRERHGIWGGLSFGRGSAGRQTNDHNDNKREANE